MKHSYKNNRSLEAFASVHQSSTDHRYWLNYIYVPPKERNQGIGTELLKQVIQEANKTATPLYLVIADGGGIGRSHLQRWYRKHDWVRQWDGMYKYTPKKGL